MPLRKREGACADEAKPGDRGAREAPAVGRVRAYAFGQFHLKELPASSFDQLEEETLMKKCGLLLMLSVMMLCALMAAQAEGLTVTDMTGRELAFDKPAERVVVMMPGDCEILYALGAGGMVVGRGEYCSYPAEVQEIEAVKSGQETNLEQIIALKPDVVVMTKMAQNPEHI